MLGELDLRGIADPEARRLLGVVLEPRQGAVYVDYHRHLAADDGLTLRQDVAEGGLHPHVRGHAIIAGVLLSTLRDAGIDTLKP
jgi:hypothetical protein